MRIIRLIVIALYCTVVAGSQQTRLEEIVVPADKTETNFTVPLPVGAQLQVLPLLDAGGMVLSPQPAITPTVSDGGASIRLSNMYFWGAARLPIQLLPGGVSVYTLQRGPALSSDQLTVDRRSPAELWLYNFEFEPLSVRWRILSQSDVVCGIETNGEPRQDCDTPAKWGEAVIGPVRSERIQFKVPARWFNPWKSGRDDPRDVALELRFGKDATSPLHRITLHLHLKARVTDAWAIWVPSWLSVPLETLRQLLFVTFWVTLGAVLLMLAQVTIPNFRQCLRMEGQIEALQERLRRIASQVGDRVFLRCHQELDSVRRALALAESWPKPAPNSQPSRPDVVASPDLPPQVPPPGVPLRLVRRFKIRRRIMTWDRLVLSGNTSEIIRVAAILPRIESRIQLTEQLDEYQSSCRDSDLPDLPPTLSSNREKQIRAIQAILARQLVTESDEKGANAALDLLDDVEASLRDFAVELEKRIIGLRRQFALEPWKSAYGPFIVDLPGCADLLKESPEALPDGGWTPGELVQRDLSAIRLEIVYQIIALRALLDANPNVATLVSSKLQSQSLARLASARMDLLKLSEDVDEQKIVDAIVAGLWDAIYEPASVTDQDVLRASFLFRDKNLNRAAVRNLFDCDWKITSTNPYTEKEVVAYERGWEVQFIPPRGKVTVVPVVYDFAGREIEFFPQTPDDANKIMKICDVRVPSTNTLHTRLMRGLLDAAITALVPVVSVALTTLHSGVPGVENLILLGFSSQAIRAAVVPESVTSASPGKTAA